jgi:hypothetical protein
MTGDIVEAVDHILYFIGILIILGYFLGAFDK